MSDAAGAGPRPERATGGPSPVDRRRDAIDVARVLALLVVVAGHLLLAVVDRHEGEVRGANLLALHPGWAALAALAPMPVFFAAAGWANAGTSPTAAAPRLRSLVGLGAVVVTTWSVAAGVTAVVSGDAGVVGDGARIATQPLWFVAAYAPLAAAGGLLARWARRPVVTVGGLLVLLAVLDLARFGLGAPDTLGWAGFHAAWGVPWLAGAWWRARRRDPGFDERRWGVGLALGAAATCAALVRWAGYDPALIDAVDGSRSNTTPPTLYTAVAGTAQVGLLLLAAPALDRLGRRFRTLWDRAGEAAVGVYAWHLTALALCGAAVAAGAPAPERLTTAWWLTRPLWWAAVLALTAALVGVTQAVRSTIRRRGGRSTGSARAIAGAVAAVAAGGVVGLRGPRTPALAIACTVLFAGAWWLLRGRARPDAVRSGDRATAAP